MVTTDTQTCALCDNDGLERTRFFQRQLVTASDFTQDQAYFLEKLRRHNRLLHGWGVVCGVRCKRGQGDCEVVIEPGYILGPYGDEIVIDREVMIDVCKQDLDGNVAGPCGQPADPWCSNVRIDRRAGDKLYIAVRYAECHDRPVRVMPTGCGCDPQECEYSRIRDSYVFRVLNKLPATYSDPMPVLDPRSIWECRDRGRPCPPCPTDPWVVLADVTLGADGKIAKLDCFAHRRYVVSLAEFYFLCRPEVSAPLLKVGLVTIRNSDSPDAGFPLNSDPDILLEVPEETNPNFIEIMFENADLDHNTVKAGETFLVESWSQRDSSWTSLQGEISPTSGTNTIHWKYTEFFFPTTYRVTLVGAGAGGILSTAGSPLDGEFLQPPSGNNHPGGDFVFQFVVVDND
jgi:hypothetical protein